MTAVNVFVNLAAVQLADLAAVQAETVRRLAR